MPIDEERQSFWIVHIACAYETISFKEDERSLNIAHIILVLFIASMSLNPPSSVGYSTCSYLFLYWLTALSQNTQHHNVHGMTVLVHVDLKILFKVQLQLSTKVCLYIALKTFEKKDDQQSRNSVTSLI